MSSPQLCVAAATVALFTATVSLSAAPPEAQAAEQGVEAQPDDNAALPAVAVVGAAGLAGAFLLGALQGYMEAKNEQKRKAKHSGSISTFTDLGGGNMDYVLD